jgi:hypothetical protein
MIPDPEAEKDLPLPGHKKMAGHRFLRMLSASESIGERSAA